MQDYSSKFKIRASAAGQIAAQPRSKADKEAGKLGKTAQTYCQTWLKEKLYDTKKEFSNKYTEKGIRKEKKSLDLINTHLGMFGLKNELSYSDEFFTGTPDAVYKSENLVLDVKTSWDVFTFPLFETEIPTKDYYFQLQVYMHLTGIKISMLAYALMPHTQDSINDMVRKYSYNHTEDETMQYYSELNDYNAMIERKPLELRVKTFNIDYDAKAISFLKSQVEKCRNYISLLQKNII
jgi:hypothetical protein